MINIPLIIAPNQSFTIRLEDDLYDITIKVANSIMAMDMIKNGTPILLGERMISGFFLIPYKYLSAGNFFITTNNGDYPDYNQFTITQFLTYLTAQEVDSINAGN